MDEERKTDVIVVANNPYIANSVSKRRRKMVIVRLQNI